MSDYEDDFEDYQDDFDAEPSTVKVAPAKSSKSLTSPTKSSTKQSKNSSALLPQQDIVANELARTAEIENVAAQKNRDDSFTTEKPTKKSERKSSKVISQPAVESQTEQKSAEFSASLEPNTELTAARVGKPVKRVKKFSPMDLSMLVFLIQLITRLQMFHFIAHFSFF